MLKQACRVVCRKTKIERLSFLRSILANSIHLNRKLVRLKPLKCSRPCSVSSKSNLPEKNLKWLSQNPDHPTFQSPSQNPLKETTLMKLRLKFKSSVLAKRNQPDLHRLTNQLSSLAAPELWL